jgi:hypothetical protein
MTRTRIRNTAFITTLAALLAGTSLAPPALAEVSGIDIVSRAVIADGREFGATGTYEQIDGRLHFLIDPANPRNQVIVDMNVAPRNGAGLVEMTADVSILAPTDSSRGNGIALVDIVNRGRKVALGFNHAGGDDPYGDGFLMREGYVIVWVGWEFDIAGNDGAVALDVPRTTDLDTAPIGGLGFAAIRDAASWIRYNPDAVVSSDYAITFGLSQSGRFLRNYLYLGFNTDERERQVFDGMIPHIAGSSRIDLNRRGSTPVSQGQYDATSFPFADDAYRDPFTGIEVGTIDNMRARVNAPKVFYTNSSVEYWGGGRVAALVHTTPDGAEDITLPDNVRFYLFAGTQHGPATFPPAPASAGQQMGNPTDYWWHLRALLGAMTGWIVDGVEPPASRHPRFADQTLVVPQQVDFPDIPGVRSPSDLTAGVRAPNPLLDGAGRPGAALPLLVPAIDADGNETSGIRHPEVQVPLATYTGWNFRNPELGDPGDLNPLAGAYIPFPATAGERERSGDPRLSIEERYDSREDYLGQVEAAGRNLISGRYLLEADLPAVIERAGAHWDLLMN